MDKKQNYISALFDYKTEKVMVWERCGDDRILVKHPAPYYFYVEDDEGEFTSLDGKKLKQVTFQNGEEFDEAVKHQYGSVTKYESDISPLDKVLMNQYYGKPVPQINVSFLDIETDIKLKSFNPEKLVEVRSDDICEKITIAKLRSLHNPKDFEVFCEIINQWRDIEGSYYAYTGKTGFSSTEDPFAPINAITIYHQWQDKFITAVVPPHDWDGTWDTKAFPDFDFDSVIVCKNEAELLRITLHGIQDSDILSGWNSEFFDMPYLLKRTEIVLGKDAFLQWCFPGARPPKYTEVERFGAPHTVVRLSGRVHLDYLDLFKKFTAEGRASYSLAAITNEELDQPKMEYEGTLEELYNHNFSHFVAYNKRDVESLRDLNKKFNLIELTSQMARENTVPLEAVLGTVKYVETGVTNYAHNVMNIIVHDKRMSDKYDKVEGAIVLTPKIGIHSWIGSVDIKSLYPSTIRALNVSPEKIVGQFTRFESDWRGIWKKDSLQHILRFEDGEIVSATGEEWNSIIRTKKWAISGYGTIFDQSNGKGIIPSILEFWYNERKRLQKEKTKYTAVATDLKEKSGVKLTAEEIKEIENDKDALGDNEIIGHKLYNKEEAHKIHQAKTLESHFDLLQYTKKIQLNSLYGALLNAFFRFSRIELGGSTTGSGRQITTHMMKTIGEVLTGDSDELVKETTVDEKGVTQNVYIATNDSIIYGDTDSCYFKTYAQNEKDAIEIADDVAETVNASFPEFLREAFNCQPGFDALIGASREIVGIRSLFQSRKKYVIKVVNQDGFAVDKIKSQGSEIKKSDTPKIIQHFLKEVLEMILDGKPYEEIETYVNVERHKIMVKDNLLALGVSKSVNNLDAAYREFLTIEKVGLGRAKLLGGTRPAINYNEHIKFREGNGANQLRSGDKVITYNLKTNSYGFRNISLPADTSKLPSWFLEDFEVDMEITEQKLFDAKLLSVFSAAGWEVPTHASAHFNQLFDF